MKKKHCLSCGFENRPDNRFCTQCGNRLPEQLHKGPRLVMLYGEQNEIAFSLEKEQITIGRDTDNDIILRDKKISKHHATIFRQDLEHWIEDLNSKNGVFINGSPIRGKERLMDGTLIKLGYTIFRFENPAFAAGSDYSETG